MLENKASMSRYQQHKLLKDSIYIVLYIGQAMFGHKFLTKCKMYRLSRNGDGQHQMMHGKCVGPHYVFHLFIKNCLNVDAKRALALVPTITILFDYHAQSYAVALVISIKNKNIDRLWFVKWLLSRIIIFLLVYKLTDSFIDMFCC